MTNEIDNGLWFQLQAVSPDGGIKSSTFSSKSCPKVANFLLKVAQKVFTAVLPTNDKFQIAQKVSKFFVYFCKKFLAKNFFKNRQQATAIFMPNYAPKLSIAIKLFILVASIKGEIQIFQISSKLFYNIHCWATFVSCISLPTFSRR